MGLFSKKKKNVDEYQVKFGSPLEDIRKTEEKKRKEFDNFLSDDDFLRGDDFSNTKPKKKPIKLRQQEEFPELIEHLTRMGILRDKIILTKAPNICLWSTSRKCLVDGRDHTNTTRVVILDIRTSLNVHDINNSNGIIMNANSEFKRGIYRYGPIPSGRDRDFFADYYREIIK